MSCKSIRSLQAHEFKIGDMCPDIACASQDTGWKERAEAQDEGTA